MTARHRLLAALLGILLLTAVRTPALAADAPVVVTLTTTEGEIDVEVFPDKAPLSSADFLRYVDQGLYDGASFYRVVREATIAGRRRSKSSRAASTMRKRFRRSRMKRLGRRAFGIATARSRSRVESRGAAAPRRSSSASAISRLSTLAVRATPTSRALPPWAAWFAGWTSCVGSRRCPPTCLPSRSTCKGKCSRTRS